MTASAIAHQIGISNNGAISGEELEKLSDEELKSKIVHYSVFARVEPLHKLKIVEAYQGLGHIVAMTGDGVNDAPALEAANIGVSMGISGTEVAKEASDIVLSDDNFASVVAAVEEGRTIFNRLRNVCTFLLTTCFGELLGLTLCVLFTGLAPLLPLQILWINLVTGVIIAVPLGLEPKTGKELKQPPRDPKVELIFKGMRYRIGFLAIMLSLSIFFVFKFALATSSLETARTMILCNVIFFEWLIAFNVRSDEITILKLGILKNIPLIIAIGAAFVLQVLILHLPFFQHHFATTPLTSQQWMIALFSSFTIFILESLRKIFFPTLFSKGKWRHESNIQDPKVETSKIEN
jgi:Ca2+-transporting ATPase